MLRPLFRFVLDLLSMVLKLMLIPMLMLMLMTVSSGIERGKNQAR